MLGRTFKYLSIMTAMIIMLIIFTIMAAELLVELKVVAAGIKNEQKGRVMRNY